VQEVYPQDIVQSFPDDDGNEIIMLKTDRYQQISSAKGENVHMSIIKRVLRGNKLILSFLGLLPRSFGEIVRAGNSEVFDGLSTEAVVHEPGEKAKVAVDSYDDHTDPVGACVGVKGSRIHGIVRELEMKINDVINWTANTRSYIGRALVLQKLSL
jgi:N utilization substance protein A